VHLIQVTISIFFTKTDRCRSATELGRSSKISVKIDRYECTYNRRIAVFLILADVVEVRTGSRSTAHWRIHFIRSNGWLRHSFAQLITLLDIVGKVGHMLIFCTGAGTHNFQIASKGLQYRVKTRVLDHIRPPFTLQNFQCSIDPIFAF